MNRQHKTAPQPSGQLPNSLQDGLQAYFRKQIVDKISEKKTAGSKISRTSFGPTETLVNQIILEYLSAKNLKLTLGVFASEAPFLQLPDTPEEMRTVTIGLIDNLLGQLGLLETEMATDGISREGEGRSGVASPVKNPHDLGSTTSHHTKSVLEFLFERFLGAFRRTPREDASTQFDPDINALIFNSLEDKLRTIEARAEKRYSEIQKSTNFDTILLEIQEQARAEAEKKYKEFQQKDLKTAESRIRADLKAEFDRKKEEMGAEYAEKKRRLAEKERIFQAESTLKFQALEGRLRDQFARARVTSEASEGKYESMQREVEAQLANLKAEAQLLTRERQQVAHRERQVSDLEASLEYQIKLRVERERETEIRDYKDKASVFQLKSNLVDQELVRLERIKCEVERLEQDNARLSQSEAGLTATVAKLERQHRETQKCLEAVEKILELKINSLLEAEKKTEAMQEKIKLAEQETREMKEVAEEYKRVLSDKNAAVKGLTFEYDCKIRHLESVIESLRNRVVESDRARAEEGRKRASFNRTVDSLNALMADNERLLQQVEGHTGIPVAIEATIRLPKLPTNAPSIQLPDKRPPPISDLQETQKIKVESLSRLVAKSPAKSPPPLEPARPAPAPEFIPSEKPIPSPPKSANSISSEGNPKFDSILDDF